MATNYRSMIDEALANARSRLGQGTTVTMEKGASSESDLIKEAGDTADALEFIAHSVSEGDGSTAGALRSQMVNAFLRKTATGGSPEQGSTQSRGVQGQVPSKGKKSINPQGIVGGNSPAQSSAQPEAKDGKKPLLESMKQADGMSLYDILMSSKEAGQGGPSELTASEDAPGIPSGNENSNRQAILGSNEAPVSASKREAKAPVRARLAEIFANSGDTQSDASGQAVWPQAASRGDIKVASVADRLSRLGK